VIDIVNELSAIHRDVARRPAGDGELVSVVLRREYPSPVDDVWEAITDPERLSRWMMPVSGDFQVGGNFQFEGNAGGEILHCEPPSLLRVTFGGETSIVEVRLSAGSAGTALVLEHTVPIEIAGSGAGALFVGPGWDGALLGLGLYLRGEVADDPVEAAKSPEAIEYSRGSVTRWADAIRASGTATEEEVAGATEATLAHFAPAG
jgi:uncharacterized protein YndB with AHSA1/START domain